MIEFGKAAFRGLSRRRLRTALTIFGVAIGVASVIIIANIGQCGTNALDSEMDSLGMSGLTISTSNSAQNVFLNSSNLGMIRKLRFVDEAAPILMENTNVTVRNSSSSALLWGIDPKAADIVSLQIVYGRFFDQRDINTFSNVCLVDQAFSKTAYQRENIIGKKISILCGGTEQPFTVVGIVRTGTGLLQNFMDHYIPTFVYIPYTTLQASVGRTDFDEIAVKIKPGSSPDDAGKFIVDRLDSSCGTKNAFQSNNLAKQKAGLTRILNIVTLILSAVGAISLLVASLSIMTVMLVSVRERTREIGIKKALGATRLAILVEFLFEAVLISLLGCAFGIAAGYVVSFAGAAYFQLSFELQPGVVLLTTGFAVLSGTVFGVYPAYKASRLKPVDALRQE